MGRGPRSSLTRRLVLAIIALLAPTAPVSHAQQGQDQQIVVSLTVTCSANYHFSHDEFSIADSVTVTLQERTVYRIVKYDNGEDGTDLEMVSFQSNLSAAGGGTVQAPPPHVPEVAYSWGYKTRPPLSHPYGGLHLDLPRGRSQLGLWANPAELVEPSDPRAIYAQAGRAAKDTINDAERQGATGPAAAYQQAMRSTFAANSKNIAVTGHASHSYDDFTGFGSGQLQVEYSITGGDSILPEAVIIPPDDYQSWLPEAGEDESTEGNQISVTVKLHKPGDPTKPADKKAKFRVALTKVSEEMGVCVNSPLKAQAHGGAAWPDLKIDPAANPELDVSDDRRSATSKRSAESATVRITSYDWGAYGHLMATAVFDVGGEVAAHVAGGGKYDLTIPQDDNGNHVADSWEKRFAGDAVEADADKDSIPTDVGTPADDGDGLSLYEEYRGFMQQDVHVRTWPLMKDLFIWDTIGRGWGDFAQSGIRPHLINAVEWDRESGETNTAVINANRGFATRGAQHILILRNKNLPGLFGEAQGDGPGTPRTTHTVAINVAACLKRNAVHPGWGDEQVRRTTAHELAHACNVWHHGNTNYDIAEWVEQDATGAWKGLFSRWLDGSSSEVAAQGGQESGMEQCIMRYIGTTLYETPTGTMKWIKGEGWQRGDKYGPAEAPGHVFCKDPKGTGVNDAERPGGPKAGNADKGKCRSQFCVNDQKHR